MSKGFMIAATGSGCGKTTITCGLLMALKQRGLAVRSFKCGPDYIDPMFHEQILGVPSENLDLFFSGRAGVRKHFFQRNDSDVSVVEGVMGLYDGQHISSMEGSSYDLACVLDLPVILVVDAHGMGRSLLALIKGFIDMDQQHQIAGFILNRISKSYYSMIRSLIEETFGIPVVGYMPKQTEGTLESRYLGLKLPQEVAHLQDQARCLGAQLQETVDLELLLKISGQFEETLLQAKDAKQCDVSQQVQIKKSQSAVRIAVARDEAFCFYYRENLRLLEAAGAQLIEFSPLHDAKLPENIHGILLGGGYPELFAKTLSENTTMRQSIQDALQQGMPSLAECGGFMYLHESITNAEGETYPMCGVIAGNSYNTGKLVRFGYVKMQEKEPRFLQEQGQTIRGHEFHYYDCDENGSDAISTKPTTGRKWESGCIGRDHWWGYAHLYYGSNVTFPKRFVAACNHWKCKGEKEME